jgi:tetratricopeptide (TPR) repeat protein
MRFAAALAFGLLLQDGAKLEAEWAKASRELAEDHARLGDYLATTKMFRMARAELERALALDPECAAARKRLEKLPGEDQRKEKDAERIRAEHAARLEKIKDRAVKLFMDLGRDASKAGLADLAARAYKKALEYDPAHRPAREGLGYSFENDRWVSPAEKAARSEFRDGVGSRSSGEAAPGPSEFEKKTGLATQKRASREVLAESCHLGQEQLGRTIQLASHSIALYHKLFALDKPLLSKPLHLILLKTRAEHLEYCKGFDPGSPNERAFVMKQEGTMYDEPPMAEAIQLDRGERFSYDYAIHATTHILNALHVGEDRAWLREGLGYYFTWMMRGTALCFCINLEGTSQEGGKAYAEPGNWPSILRQLVSAGRDADMKRILVSEMNDMDTPKLIKSWSLIDYLVQEHRAKLPELAAALREDQKDKGPAAIEKTLGMTPEQLDQAWRDFVRRTY